MGSRYYQLHGLKPHTWYEVKISYPASIPATFSVELKKGNSEVGMTRLRKLLNTEKLIFKADILDKDEVYVLITVEPEGFVALREVQERESILFNIGHGTQATIPTFAYSTHKDKVKVGLCYYMKIFKVWKGLGSGNTARMMEHSSNLSAPFYVNCGSSPATMRKERPYAGILKQRTLGRVKSLFV